MINDIRISYLPIINELLDGLFHLKCQEFFFFLYRMDFYVCYLF
jgi:hypothetical protein